MKVVILTSSLQGNVALQLKGLFDSESIDIQMVIFNKGEIKDKKKFYKKKLQKFFKIGLLGTLNGVRMREWYGKDAIKYSEGENIEQLCIENGIPFNITPSINSRETISLFHRAMADLGLSLGNGYIGSKIFNIPKFGMINIHHEELPAYQNAQSVIWQMYNGSGFTGYTIHKIDKNIDSGEIIYQEKFPIEIRKDLADTVSYNYFMLWKRSAVGLVKVLENFDYYFNNGSQQSVTKKNIYTTPTIIQFLKMKRQFLKLKNA